MNSALYTGWVQHRRFTPHHQFRYRVYQLFLMLDELAPGPGGARPVLDDSRLFSIDRPNLVSFYRRDHVRAEGAAGAELVEPLDHTIRTLVERDTGQRPTGRIGLLTNPRYFGSHLSHLEL